MIAQLTGVVVHEAPDQIVVDVSGVGYLVHTPVGTSARLKADDQGRVCVVIQTNVREDAIQLFGFSSEDEKLIFNKLTGVSGIGPKLGLSVLSALRSDEVVRAIQREDIARFTSVSGVGKKTAQRIILELKSAFDGFSLVSAVVEPDASPEATAVDDLRSALLNLGFRPQPVEDAVAELSGAELSFEEMLREAMKFLS